MTQVPYLLRQWVYPPPVLLFNGQGHGWFHISLISPFICIFSIHRLGSLLLVVITQNNSAGPPQLILVSNNLLRTQTLLITAQASPWTRRRLRIITAGPPIGTLEILPGLSFSLLLLLSPVTKLSFVVLRGCPALIYRLISLVLGFLQEYAVLEVAAVEVVLQGVRGE